MSIPSPYASSRTSLPLPGMHPPGPVYSSRPAPGFSGVPAGHPFAQSSVSVPGVPSTSPKRKPGPVEPAKRPQSAPPPPPAVVEKRPSTVGIRDRPPPPPAKDGSGGGGGKPDKGPNDKAGNGGEKAKQLAGKEGGKPPAPAKQASAPGGAKGKPPAQAAAKFTPWSFTSTEPEFPPASVRPAPPSMSRTMLLAELNPPSTSTTVTVTAEPEEKKRGWTKVKRALTGGNFRRSGRKPKKLELDLDGLGRLDFDRALDRDRLSALPPVPPERLALDLTPREIEMSGGGHGRRWEAPMSAGYNVPSVYAGMPGGSHYDLRTSTIGYFPSHFVASAVDVGAVGGLRGSRTLSGVKGGAW